jgi:hypothetical protein
MTSNNSVNVDFAKSWKHKLTFEHTKHKQYSTLTIGIQTNFGWNITLNASKTKSPMRRCVFEKSQNN